MDVSQPRHVRHTVLAWILIVTAFAIGAMALYAPQLVPFLHDREAPLSGTISLTMTAAGITTPYVYDVAEGSLKPLDHVSDISLLQGVQSSAGDIAYRCADGNKQAVCVLYKATDAHTVISKNAYALKRYLEWSPDGTQVLYVAQTAAEAKSNSPDTNEWGVFLAAADGSGERQIGVGSIAFFTPDGRAVLYLAKDGLHQVELDTEIDTLVWPVQGGVANRYMTIAVSPDGKKLAWANPYAHENKGMISHYTVTWWHPLSMRFDSQTSIRAWQMRFSPDSTSLALSADDAKTGEPGLYIYRLGREAALVRDLQAYERKTQISEWR